MDVANYIFANIDIAY